ncbi:MAG: shikimate dehydrogenase [Salinarimonadaceae bacterium]|nr:MAG: shikimate dehydrogenase [Salinarimonadaceae bacterium]
MSNAAIPKAFVVGHPIAHSRSPLIHGHWLERYGIAGAYERIDVAPVDFAAFLVNFAGNGFVGGNVTLPHKEAAFRGVRVATARARRLSAVNTLWIENGLLHGDNTDVLGFVASLDAALGIGWENDLRRAVVLGAGGAARAIVAGLLDRGVDSVAIVNRTPEKAREIVAFDPTRLTAHGLDALTALLAGARLLVNTTSLGMTGQPPLQVDLAPMPEGAAVADIVYAPLETALLKQARERGLAAIDGLGMLLHQAVPGFERWFGIRPEVTPELRAAIVADLEKKP